MMGQEEDAVDNLATVSMLASDTPQMDEYLVMAMLGWFALAAESYDELVFYGEHDLDQQRGYQTLCLMVGADEQFNDLASDLGLPDDRIDSCIYEYELAADSWEAVTADVVRPEGEKGNKISVVYEPAPEDLKEVADLFQESGLLEQVAGEMDDTFELPEKITYKAQSCGEMNAFWDPEAREMVMCYELMALFATVFVEELME
ncbi:DUF4344 domain-containing metallopeptidase [Roseibium sp. TrichSKD4]|uniref:DUF4344 domain-containing metallopeptidase n=1 Tax=Roseibium sp. TrichSKD4 TaxID=744980 RepID=UPI00210F7574|nr:DUF4344 domain-containing metallopeptidase [Roseibium sp. TrichSKD4]